MLRMSSALSFPAALTMLALTGACTGPLEDTGPDAPPINQDTDVEEVKCEAAAPVLEELTVTPGQFEFEDVLGPAIKVSGTGSDTDGNLHQMGLIVWWDDMVDGSVDITGVGTDTGLASLDPNPCTTPAGTLEFNLQVDGKRFAYATAYEFAGVVYDAAELRSSVVIASGVTPGAPI